MLLAPPAGLGQHERGPRFEVPCQGGDDHVGPVAEQVVEGRSQCMNAILELTNEVLLVATIVGDEHDLLDWARAQFRELRE